MTEKELHDFFENYSDTSTFIRKKKIYELTDSFDLFLLKELKEEFVSYYLTKISSPVDYDTNNEDDSTDTSDSNTFNPEEIDFDSLEEGYSMEIRLPERQPKQVLDTMDFLISVIDSKIGKEGYDSIEDISENVIIFRDDVNDMILYSRRKDSGISIERKLEKNKENEDDDDISLGNGIKTTMSEKIICLKKLGIIDFLGEAEPFSHSVNKMAEAIAIFVDAKPRTVQKPLNALIGRQINDKDYPLKSEKTIKVVEAKLLKLGFIPK